MPRHQAQGKGAKNLPAFDRPPGTAGRSQSLPPASILSTPADFTLHDVARDDGDVCFRRKHAERVRGWGCSAASVWDGDAAWGKRMNSDVRWG